jgi:hypothetical protein
MWGSAAGQRPAKQQAPNIRAPTGQKSVSAEIAL